MNNPSARSKLCSIFCHHYSRHHDDVAKRLDSIDAGTVAVRDWHEASPIGSLATLAQAGLSISHHPSLPILLHQLIHIHTTIQLLAVLIAVSFAASGKKIDNTHIDVPKAIL